MKDLQEMRRYLLELEKYYQNQIRIKAMADMGGGSEKTHDERLKKDMCSHLISKIDA